MYQHSPVCPIENIFLLLLYNFEKENKNIYAME